MKTRPKTLLILCATALTLTLLSFDLPTGWHKTGSKPSGYDMGFETLAGRTGRVVTIKSNSKKVKGEFGTLMQNSLPNKFLGKRVRMSGLIKTQNVVEWAGLWFRVDDVNGVTLSFDNMKDGKKDRGIVGTNEWNKYEVILDVPEQATFLAYGALLCGTGQIWFDDISFEVVGNDIPTTGKNREEMYPKKDETYKEPFNLNFEQ